MINRAVKQRAIYDKSKWVDRSFNQRCLNSRCKDLYRITKVISGSGRINLYQRSADGFVGELQQLNIKQKLT